MAGIAVINGLMSMLSDAKISLTDRGMLFGHAVFETILVLNKTFIEWNAHYARLQHACKKAHLICPTEAQLLKDCLLAVNECEKLTAENKNSRMSLKIIVTGGNHLEFSMPSDHNSEAQPQPNIYILCQPVHAMNSVRRLEGFAIKSFLDERGAFLIGIKSTNYLFQFLCLDKAKQLGFDDALFKNPQGEYTEAVTSSFIWFNSRQHVFSTPPEGNCLVGTSVLKLERALKKADIDFKYKALNKNKTTNCAGCALISSVRGVVPIKSIDDFSFDIEKHSQFFKFLIELFNS